MSVDKEHAKVKGTIHSANDHVRLQCSIHSSLLLSLCTLPPQLQAKAYNGQKGMATKKKKPEKLDFAQGQKSRAQLLVRTLARFFFFFFCIRSTSFLSFTLNTINMSIHTAALEGHLGLVKQLVEADKNAVLAKDEDERQPLHWAGRISICWHLETSLGCLSTSLNLQGSHCHLSFLVMLHMNSFWKATGYCGISAGTTRPC